MEPGERRLYVVYDVTAFGGNTFDASILFSCQTRDDSISLREDFGNGAAVCYSYRETPADVPLEGIKRTKIDDQRFEWFYRGREQANGPR